MRKLLDRDNRALLMGVLLFTLFFRLATLMMINTGVDERDYWFSAKALSHGLPYPDLTHRTTRFAIILPVALAQLILGTHPNVYYVLPVLNALCQAAIAFVIGLRLRGRLTGVLAALALVLFPYMARAGSQVRPEIFSITYVLLVLFCFIEYMERDARELSPLLWSGAVLFLAYEAKITNIFFLPGLLLVILIYKKKPVHALLLAGMVLFLFAVETGLYAAFTQYKLGELQIIFARHIESGEPFVVARFVDLFGRYSSARLQPYWQIPFALFAIGAVVYLIRGTDKRLCALSIAALSFFVGITFEVAGLHPIAPAEPFINRYFCAVLGPVFLVLAYAAHGLVVRIFPSRHGSVRLYLAFMAFAVVAVLGLFSWPRLPAGIRAYANSPLHLRRHPLALNEYYRRMANQAFAQGTAIVAADGLGGGNAIQTCENFFIDLASYTNGRPPDHTRVQVGDGEYLVLTSDGKGTITTELLAVIRGPFRVAAMPASSIHLLTSDSVDGKKGPADEDENQ